MSILLATLSKKKLVIRTFRDCVRFDLEKRDIRNKQKFPFLLIPGNKDSLY